MNVSSRFFYFDHFNQSATLSEPLICIAYQYKISTLKKKDDTVNMTKVY